MNDILAKLFGRAEPKGDPLKYLTERWQDAEGRAHKAGKEHEDAIRAAFSILKRYGPEVEQEFRALLG